MSCTKFILFLVSKLRAFFEQMLFKVHWAHAGMPFDVIHEYFIVQWSMSFMINFGWLLLLFVLLSLQRNL